MLSSRQLGDSDPVRIGSLDASMASLRLYVAHSTPNSVRAEMNLAAALAVVDPDHSGSSLEVIDVFLQPKRAMRDGVIVTPTLVGIKLSNRIVIIGDLTDRAHLEGVLASLTK